MVAVQEILQHGWGRSAIALLMCVAPVPAQDHKQPDMSESSAPHTNRLIHSLSPYLLQHAHNPVDWYPWGEEALTRARRENKPIFLSVGYSACHWCHVMEHESFEDQEVADLLNQHFVSIKVDREERPDIDEIYMQATLAMTGSGGWPMSVFLKPDGTPFWAGTYLPKAGFLQLLNHLATGWEREPEEIDRVAGQLKAYLQRWAGGSEAAEGVPPVELVRQTARGLAGAFDLELGGFKVQAGNRNKFPPSMAMELLLRTWSATGDPALRAAVQVTLDRMAAGGIHDHLGGGFARYSTDPEWLVPHFEKMLYDQALVSSIYLDGYQVFGKPRYAEVARGIFEYVIGDLQSPQGGFYSTRDADSEGLEGKYYIWTRQEVREVLGDADAAIFCAYYDVTDQGNWTERLGHAPPGPKNILNIKHEAEKVARGFDLDPAELHQRLGVMRAKLLAVRAQRTPPGLDDKVLTSWNGLMIASLAKGARVLNEPRYAEAAVRAAEFVLQNMRRDGRLLRAHRGGKSRLLGYLDDYAFFIEGLLNLYEATFDPRWLQEAAALTDVCAEYHADTENGAFFFTARDGEQLIARTKNPRDGAIPSGNSVHALNLLRLQILLNQPSYRLAAESIFKCFAGDLERSPTAYERLLCALDFYHARVREVALAGDSAGLSPLVEAVYSGYLPNKVVAGLSPPASGAGIALLKNKKPVKGRATVFVCENYACKAPVHSSEEVRALLWPVPTQP